MNVGVDVHGVRPAGPSVDRANNPTDVNVDVEDRVDASGHGAYVGGPTPRGVPVGAAGSRVKGCQATQLAVIQLLERCLGSANQHSPFRDLQAVGFSIGLGDRRPCTVGRLMPDGAVARQCPVTIICADDMNDREAYERGWDVGAKGVESVIRPDQHMIHG